MADQHNQYEVHHGHFVVEPVPSITGNVIPRPLEPTSSPSSLPITPATETFAGTLPTTRSASATPNEASDIDSVEVQRLRLQLAQAQNRISHLEAENRLVKQDGGRVTPSLSHLSEAPLCHTESPTAPRVHGIPNFPAPVKAPFPRDNAWTNQDDCCSDTSDALSAGGFNRARTIWGNTKAGLQNPFPQSQGGHAPEVPQQAWGSRNSTQPYVEPSVGQYAPPLMDAGYRADRMTLEHEYMPRSSAGRRGNRYENRFASGQNYGGYGGYSLNGGPGQYESGSGFANGPPASGPVPGGVSLGMGMYTPYQQQPMGATLSPHATEFNSHGPSSTWKAEV